MKLNYYIYSLIAGVLLMFSACTPDEYEMGSKAFAPEDLVEGVAEEPAGPGVHPAVGASARTQPGGRSNLANGL